MTKPDTRKQEILDTLELKFAASYQDNGRAFANAAYEAGRMAAGREAAKFPLSQLRYWLSVAIFHGRSNAQNLKLLDGEKQFKEAVQGLKQLEIYLFSLAQPLPSETEPRLTVGATNETLKIADAVIEHLKANTQVRADYISRAELACVIGRFIKPNQKLP